MRCKIDDCAIALRDAEGAFLYANEAFARLKTPSMEAALGQDDAEVLASGVPSECERELSDSEGRKFVYIVRKFPIVLGESRLLLILGERNEPTVIPVTEAARARFFSAVSHDLRSPLNAIVGYAQLQHAKDPARFQEAITAIGEGSRLLISAVDGLLTLLGPQSVALPAKKVTFNLAEATLKVAESFAAAAAENNVELLIRQGELPLIEFAGDLYRDLLGRLVDYAVHRTMSAPVVVQTTYKAGCLQLMVTDSGRHLSDAEVIRVLNPSEDSSASEEAASATLNLSVAKRIVERLNGAFDIRNESNAQQIGVTVMAIFHDVPLTDLLKRAQFERTQKMRTMRIEDPMRFEKRILLVDDHPVNLRILSLLLGALGFKNVSTAQSGERGLELFKEKPFDVVLTDLMMPGMNGREFLRELRQLPNCARLPVYAVTADTSAPITCAKDGFTDILIKPVTKDVLKSVL